MKLVPMASLDYAIKIKNYITANVYFEGQEHKNVSFKVLDSLCNDVILGLNFQAQTKVSHLITVEINHHLPFAD